MMTVKVMRGSATESRSLPNTVTSVPPLQYTLDRYDTHKNNEVRTTIKAQHQNAHETSLATRTTVNSLTQTKSPQRQFNISTENYDRPTQCTFRMCLHLHNVYRDPPTPPYDELAIRASANWLLTG